MNDPIDMVQLVKSLPTRPRGRACIVLTHDYYGQKEWAAQLARKTNSEHVNLLELFAQDKTLGNRIRQFLVPRLFEFLKNQYHTPVLIVSGMEFLKATWIGQTSAVNQFATNVMTWSESPCLLFVLQYDKTLANYDFGTRYQETFLVDQKETLGL